MKMQQQRGKPGIMQHKRHESSKNMRVHSRLQAGKCSAKCAIPGYAWAYGSDCDTCMG